MKFSYYFLLAIYYSLSIVYIFLFARVILSWFRLPEEHPIIRILNTLTEPILGPVRYLIRKSIFGGRNGGMIIDISPLIAFIFLQFLQNFIRQFL